MATFSRKRIGRFLISRLLWTTNLCRLFSIPLGHAVKMRFFPTSMSAGLWMDPQRHLREAEFILTRLREGDTFVDVGANVGFLTLLAARRVGPSGTVIAIEAHPRTFAFMRDNLRINDVPQVRPIHAAVGSRTGETGVSDFRADDMNHLQAGGRVKVPLITLDSLGLNGRVAVLKTDTEGFEPFIFEGARDLLSRVDCVYFECSEWNLNRYGRKSGELLAIMQSAGFAIYQPGTSGLVPVEPEYDAAAGGNLVALRKQ